MKTKKELANNPTNIVLLAKCLYQKERFRTNITPCKIQTTVLVHRLY